MGVSVWPLSVQSNSFLNISFISLTFLSDYFSVAWAFHIRSQQEPGRFDRLDKGRVRTTLRRPGA